jgi:predicted HAD superfamily Cof-like phosphohydrolase
MGMPLDVKMFLSACDQKPSPENAALYKTLMEEEFNEFINAHWNKDEHEQLDGCMDLIWVTLGFCHMKGYDICGAWDEVVRTNMAKVDPQTGKVRRREDGKILKPEGWTPPDMNKFIKK